MKERPFVAYRHEVRAILDGRQTRFTRVIKPQPEESEYGNLMGEWLKKPLGGLLVPKVVDIAMECPYGQPGDLLWVRETWAKEIPGRPNGVSYRADHLDLQGDGPANPIRWRPSIHMPRWASRISLEVVGVRTDRLKEISEEDCCRELGAPIKWTGEGQEPYRRDVVSAFSYLWDGINGKRHPWDSNPWVWVLTFEVMNGER